MAAPLTPADVKSREFAFSRKGYDPIDVDEFVDEVCETIALYKAREEAFSADHAQDQAMIDSLRRENERLVGDVARIMEETERVNVEVARANEESARLYAEIARLSNVVPEPRADASGAALELLRSAQDTASKAIGVALAQAERISQYSETEMDRAKERVMGLRRVEDSFRSQLLDLLDRVRFEAETGSITAGADALLEIGQSAGPAEAAPSRQGPAADELPAPPEVIYVPAQEPSVLPDSQPHPMPGDDAPAQQIPDQQIPDMGAPDAYLREDYATAAQQEAPRASAEAEPEPAAAATGYAEDPAGAQDAVAAPAWQATAPWETPQPAGPSDGFSWEPAGPEAADQPLTPAAPARSRRSPARKRIDTQEWPGLIDYAEDDAAAGDGTR